MIFVIDTKYKKYRFNEEKIALVEYWPDCAELMDAENDGLGERFRITLDNGATYEWRGHPALVAWEQLTRDSCMINVT